MRKTYGAPGLMEWHALIRTGRSKVRIPFTGGSQSGYGAVPAQFTTDNAVLQRIIETSGYFRSGRIRLLETVGAVAEMKEK